MTGYFFDTDEGEWQPHPRFEGALVRPLITKDQNPGMTVARVRLLPGCGLPLHAHENSTETFLVLKGTATCRVDSQEVVMHPGQMGYAPPGVMHQVRNLGDEPVEAISIFNPPL